MTFLGNMNAKVQYKLNAESTDLMICTRPAYDNEIPSHPLIRASIFEISGWQSEMDNLDEIKGRPSYLIGRWPS